MRYKAEGDLGGDDESLKNSSRLRPPDGSSTTTSPFVWYDKTATRGLKGFERRFKALKDFEICLKALTDVYRRWFASCLVPSTRHRDGGWLLSGRVEEEGL